MLRAALECPFAPSHKAAVGHCRIPSAKLRSVPSSPSSRSRPWGGQLCARCRGLRRAATAARAGGVACNSIRNLPRVAHCAMSPSGQTPSKRASGAPFDAPSPPPAPAGSPARATDRTAAPPRAAPRTGAAWGPRGRSPTCPTRQAARPGRCMTGDRPPRSARSSAPRGRPPPPPNRWRTGRRRAAARRRRRSGGGRGRDRPAARPRAPLAPPRLLGTGPAAGFRSDSDSGWAGRQAGWNRPARAGPVPDSGPGGRASLGGRRRRRRARPGRPGRAWPSRLSDGPPGRRAAGAALSISLSRPHPALSLSCTDSDGRGLRADRPALSPLQPPGGRGLGGGAALAWSAGGGPRISRPAGPQPPTANRSDAETAGAV
jgi:hypothetical protein